MYSHIANCKGWTDFEIFGSTILLKHPPPPLLIYIAPLETKRRESVWLYIYIYITFNFQ